MSEHEASISYPDSVKASACSLHRTVSANGQHSRRSLRSRHDIIDNDAASLTALNLSVEDDGCVPQPTSDEKSDKRKLYIDFDLLEMFTVEEEQDRTPPKNQPKPRVFNDLHAQHQKNPISDDRSSRNLSGDLSFDGSAEPSILDATFEMQQVVDISRFTSFLSAP